MNCACTSLSPGQNCDCTACNPVVDDVTVKYDAKGRLTTNIDAITPAQITQLLTAICANPGTRKMLQDCAAAPLLSDLGAVPTGPNPRAWIDDTQSPSVMMTWDSIANSYSSAGNGQHLSGLEADLPLPAGLNPPAEYWAHDTGTLFKLVNDSGTNLWVDQTNSAGGGSSSPLAADPGLTISNGVIGIDIRNLPNA